MKLTGFLQKLSGEALVVELKNGTVVLGTVIGTDVAMNMHLRVVTLTAKDKNPVKMDALSIRGSNVRYIMCVAGGAVGGRLRGRARGALAWLGTGGRQRSQAPAHPHATQPHHATPHYLHPSQSPR